MCVNILNESSEAVFFAQQNRSILNIWFQNTNKTKNIDLNIKYNVYQPGTEEIDQCRTAAILIFLLDC